MTGSPDPSPDGEATRPRTVAATAWGRVDDAGTVWVRTSSGERPVGSWQAAEPEAGLAFFARRFDDLATQVALLEQRLETGAVTPDDAAGTVRRLRPQVAEAQAVGDLDGLLTRLDRVEASIAERRAERRAERARVLDEARERKDAVVREAEDVAESSDWRRGADRLRTLLEEWKSLPRLDKPTDDALWHRFSSARSLFTRRRRAHFAAVGEQREAVRAAKEAIVAEAEELADSTDWGPTAGRFRDLMGRWKAAGRASREVDDALWERFRAAQDRFFASRNEALSARDAGHRDALEARQRLLDEAEALVPVTDVRAARDALRSVQLRWDAAGRAPREAVRGLEARLRRVDDAVREAERSEWRRTDPAARARAQETVDRLRQTIAGLERALAAARERGDDGAAEQAHAALAARKEWLAQAEKVLADFS